VTGEVDSGLEPVVFGDLDAEPVVLEVHVVFDDESLPVGVALERVEAARNH